MVTLFCAIVGVVRDAFAVNIDAVESVGDLKEAIKKVRGLKDFDAKNLQLFLAKKDGAWLPDDKALDVLLQSKLDASLYTKLCSSWRLDSPALFGPNVSLGEEVVHVLVVPSEAAPQTSVLGRRSAQMRDDQQQLQPFPKKPNTQKYVQFAGPVDEQDFCIPLETISTFQQIREGFSYGNRPLYLLHGPRQFGKTTIAKGVEKWLTTSRSDVMCLFFEVNELVAADETEFWNRLGKLVSKESN
ncbi:hypothetical protein PR003_g19247 [Phytophthora rubi]|uniref:Crinkler effector protein N-terminal domain-containing protein n=1 Tax=Phytophthora rubi TaxID=129364 RepID=A0A6A3JST3_9STRA|nr:hypothetical protein PR002_g18744 [Phytophthora rubi]KAE9002358.1 hypothetical protein PR001_g18276 [Phytophthora rubi]KAE9314418.1 hypothetical protein PR003_g19247 [Phytophthora rubi]